MWWSGWGWGPRFLVPIMPFIALMALPVFENLKSQITKFKVRPLKRLRWRTVQVFGIWYLIFVVLVFFVSVSVQILGTSVGFDEYEDIMTKTHLRGDPEGDLYKYGLDMLWSWPHSPILGHADLLRKGNTDLAWLPRGQIDWLMLIPLVMLLVIAGLGLVYSLQNAEVVGKMNLALCVLCASVAILVLWRAEQHPLSATYDRGPLEGYAALDLVMSRAQPGDGAMLVRFITSTEMDRFPRFPPVYGIPDDGLFGAEWNSDLERLIDNAQARHPRLWLVVKSEEDSFAAQIAARLRPRWRRTERTQAGGYWVVLFEPR
jgi:hypothetical protein